MSWEIGLIIASSVASATAQVVTGVTEAKTARLVAEMEIRDAERAGHVLEIDALSDEADRLRDFRIYESEHTARTNSDNLHFGAMMGQARKELSLDINKIGIKKSIEQEKLESQKAISRYGAKTARLGGYTSFLKAGGTLMTGGYKAKKLHREKGLV